MSIRVYNTLTKEKAPLETVQRGKVGIYLCGPTVYKPAHIGHMVGPVIFDTIKRFLVYSGYEVTLVVNITDVDDKLIAAAREQNTTMQAVAERCTADYFENLRRLGVDTIDYFPRATQHIGEIIEITRGLIERGYAYASNGDVYFDVTKDPEYGKLSHRSVAEMQAGARVEVTERKRNPMDFALWKSAKPGEPSWDSPWGAGRPGWHIECSAMSMKYLGRTFDIHGGGLDLVFPHHENEVAQSESFTGTTFARYWLHNGLMQEASEVGKVGGRTTRAAVEGDLESQEARKISKSRGSDPVSRLFERHQPETVRFFLLSSHYRRPIEFSDERIEEVGRGLEKFYRFFERYERITGRSFYEIEAPARRDAGSVKPPEAALPEIAEFYAQVADCRHRFLEAMDDDFNTGAAAGVLHELVGVLNRFADTQQLEGTAKGDARLQRALTDGARVLRELGMIFGVFRQPVSRGRAEGELTGKLIELFIVLRAEARKAKNFALADRIRSGLAELGVTLEDRPDGTSWRLG